MQLQAASPDRQTPQSPPSNLIHSGGKHGKTVICEIASTNVMNVTPIHILRLASREWQAEEHTGRNRWGVP